MAPVHERAPALVDVGWLANHIGDPDLVVVDASVAAGRESAERIPRARRFDLDAEMSAQSDLPHTLPDARAFTVVCQRLGISRRSRVVAYDSQGIYSSARARWMLVAAGHRGVSVLDGGLPAWTDAGLPTEPWSSEQQDAGDFVAAPFDDHVVDAARVLAALDRHDTVVLDARSRARFEGREQEPRPGLRSGHMPGAVNLPFAELLDDQQRMLPPERLREKFDGLANSDTTLIASCGSGVTACVVGLAAEILGRDFLLYDGSWSEWGRPGSLPVVSGV